MMEILFNEEKEKYFLKLAQEEAKLPPDYNIETIVIKEEEYEISKLQKQLQAMQGKFAQILKDKDKLTK